MAEIGLEIRSCDLQGPSTKSVVFQVMTPWHQELRIWKLRQIHYFNTLTPTLFLEHLKKRGGREIMLIIECRLTTASPDDLRHKQPGEDLAGMTLPFNLYDLIMMNEQLPLQTTLPIMDIFQGREVASAVVCLTCNFWPNFHQSLKHLSPDLEYEMLSGVRHGVEAPRHLFVKHDRADDSATPLELSKDFSFLDQYSMMSPNSSAIIAAQNENENPAMEPQPMYEPDNDTQRSPRSGPSSQQFSTIQQLLAKTSISGSSKPQPLSPSSSANTPPRLKRLRENHAMETSGVMSPQMFSTVPPTLLMKKTGSQSANVSKNVAKGSLRRRYFLSLAGLANSPSKSDAAGKELAGGDPKSDQSSVEKEAKLEESDSDSDSMFEASEMSDATPVKDNWTPLVANK